jgi:lanosterol synthase
MVVRRRGEDKQANGSTNGTIKPLQDYDAELKTDHSRWRMRNVDGRQTWHYLESDEQLKAWPMTAADKYYMGQDTVRQQKLLPARCLYSDVVIRARKHFPRLQLPFKQLRMAWHSTPVYSLIPATGAANMVVLCSCCLV